MARLTTELVVDNNGSPIQQAMPVASATGKTLTTGASSLGTTLPAGAVITFKSLTTVAHVKLGIGAQTATTADAGWDFYLAIDQERTVPVGTATHVAAISTGAGSLKMWGNG